MNPEIKAAWVAWLRDPNNKQGRQYLRTKGNKYCCLGGLCELAVEAGIVRRERSDQSASLYVSIVDESDHSYAVLPSAVVRWAGLSTGNPDVIHGAIRNPVDLSYLNDTLSLNFNQIADVIEEQL